MPDSHDIKLSTVRLQVEYHPDAIYLSKHEPTLLCRVIYRLLSTKIYECNRSP